MKNNSLELLIHKGLKEVRSQILNDWTQEKTPKPLIILEKIGSCGEIFAEQLFLKIKKTGEKLQKFNFSVLPPLKFSKILLAKNPKTDQPMDSRDWLLIKEAQNIWSKNLKEKDRKTLQRHLLAFLKKGKKGIRLILVVPGTPKELEKAFSQKRITKTVKDLLIKNSYCLPALKDLQNHIPELIELVLRKTFPGIKIDELALKRLQEYSWPNDFSELDQCLRLAASNCRDDVITIDDLPIPIPVASGDEIYPQILPPDLRG